MIVSVGRPSTCPAAHKIQTVLPRVIDMCKAAVAATYSAADGSCIAPAEKPPPSPHSPPTIQRRTLSTISPPALANLALIRPPFTVRRALLLLLLLSCVSFASLYAFHRGFRRTVQFWRGFAPLIAKYKFVRLKAERIDRVGPEELERRLNEYRRDTAPKLVDLILRMGGIYIKIGQVMSTIGQGLLPQEYVDALQPLQDGVPPRNYEQVSRIVQESTGKSMDELFLDFDEKPIGSASVAQVHRATLRPKRKGEEPMRVVVKVQYPEGETFPVILHAINECSFAEVIHLLIRLTPLNSGRAVRGRLEQP